MEKDQLDTGADQLAPDNDAQEEQDDAADDASEGDADTQESESSERLYANKYKSPEELEAAYEDIQRFVGSRKILEEKATAYDRLVASQADAAGQKTVEMPQLSTFIQDDGTVDTGSYDKAMGNWWAQTMGQIGSTAQHQAKEQVDIRKAEADYPYLSTDHHAARAVMAAYHSGDFPSVYEAARDYDQYRQATLKGGEQAGQDAAKRELSRKVRGNTERPTGRTGDTGEMTEAKFKTLTQAQKKDYLFRTGIFKK